MLGTLRSEIRKLLTVRSTYLLVGSAIIIVLFYAGFVTGYRINPAQLHDPTFLSQQVRGAVGFVTLFAGIAGLLLLAHEYRHNTIIYTLTLAKNRSSVLLAKIIVVSVFMMLFGLFIMVLSPLATVVGAHLHGLHLVPQTLDYGNLLWRCLFYVWGYGMFALILTALIRNQIGAIVTLLVMPTLAENILSLLLKGNTKYLPFTSLESVVNDRAVGNATPGHSARVALLYIVVGWAVAWYLFLKRDAN